MNNIRPVDFFRIIPLAGLWILLTNAAQAQSWQWAKGCTGASFGNFYANGIQQPVHILDVANDVAGNTYMLYTSLNVSLTADGHTLAGFGGRDIVLSSYRCDGAYRWSKVIGTSLDSDKAVAVKADGVGGVYVCGTMTLLSGSGVSSGGHIDSDTTIGNWAKTMFIVKWDTAGNYKWLRMPQPDTISHYSANSKSLMLDMDVDEQGTTYLLAYLTPGVYGGGNYIVPASGNYVLKYNAAGQMIGGTPIPITISTNNPAELLYSHFTYSAGLSRFIITGSGPAVNGPSGTISVGSTPIAWSTAYVASVSASTGALSWLKTTGQITGLFIYGRAAADASGDIYITGAIHDSTVFNGYTFRNYPGVLLGTGYMPLVMKMSGATGAAIWATNARATEYGGGFCLAVSNSKVLTGGRYRDKIGFPADSLHNNFPRDSFDCFTVQLDAATGVVQHLDTFGTTGTNDWIYRISADKRGNFYAVGNYGGGSLRIGGGSVAAVNSPWSTYLGKWGYANCNCTLPVPAFNASAPSGKTVQYTYTGTTSGIDSLVWLWGDGTRQKVTAGFTTPLPHTFTTNGRYNVCVTAYSGLCGTGNFCRQTPLSIVSSAASSVLVYPNPAHQYIMIEDAVGSQATVCSITGEILITAAITTSTQKISTATLQPGVYMLVLSHNASGKEAFRLMVK